MAGNSLLQPSLISRRTLAILVNNLVFAALVNRQFEDTFVKIGSTLTVRKPNRFVSTNGPGLTIQNITEPSTSISISNQTTIGFQFSSQDLTLTIEEFSERYLKPIAETIANTIDYGVAANFTQVFNVVGAPGTVPNAYSFLALLGKRMDKFAVPMSDRNLVLGPDAYWDMTTGLSGLFVQSVSEPALKGFLAKIANFNIYEDQNIQSQTVGAYAGTPVVNGSGQTGSTLITNGWSASINGLLNVGDVFTIQGVYAVNPQNRKPIGNSNTKDDLQNFVVTSTANSDGSGNSTISIYPPIVTSGPYQTVNVSPANLAPISVVGTASTAYAQNLGFVRDAFGLVCVPMELPEGVDFKYRQEYKGLSMRIIRAYDVNNDVFPCRVDVLWGTSTFYPELAARLTN